MARVKTKRLIFYFIILPEDLQTNGEKETHVDHASDSSYLIFSGDDMLKFFHDRELLYISCTGKEFFMRWICFMGSYNMP